MTAYHAETADGREHFGRRNRSIATHRFTPYSGIAAVYMLAAAANTYTNTRCQYSIMANQLYKWFMFSVVTRVCVVFAFT